MKGPVRILLVDDHDIVRVGFRLLLNGTPDLRVVAEAGTGEDALTVARETPINVAVLDITLPGMSGLETARRLLAYSPGLRVLGLSQHEDPSYVRNFLCAGGLGYLSKRSDPDRLLEAVRSVAAGRAFLDPALAQQLALQEVLKGDNPLTALSEREFEVFLHLARGDSVNDIAARLYLSPRTVGTHLYHVKQKLSLRNQAEMTLLAIRHNLLTV